MVEATVAAGGIIIPVPGTNTMAYYEPPKDVLNTRIEDLIGNSFIMKRGQTEREREETTLCETASCEQFEGLKYVGLLFSMEKSPPCKQMLKKLKNFYTDVNLEERQFEVVLVSSDEKQEDFDTHYNSMPWMAINYNDPICNQLRDKFQIVGVPALVILDATTGFPVTIKARKDLSKNVKQVFDSWDKLCELKRGWAVQRAEEDAMADAQKRESEHIEKLKKQAEKAAQEGGTVAAEVV